MGARHECAKRPQRRKASARFTEMRKSRRRPQKTIKTTLNNRNLPYEFRNAMLGLMGYESYSEYLRSELWDGIRESVLRDHPACYCCGFIAQQVHHAEYTNENLSGTTLDGLYSLCGACHVLIEFSATGDKATLSEANDLMFAMRKGDECHEMDIYRRKIPGWIS